MSHQLHGLLATTEGGIFFICCRRSWCVSDNVAGLMMFHCSLGCLLGWAWLWVVFLAVGILRIVVWGGILLGSSCTVRRVVGLLWWVCICMLYFVCSIIIFDITWSRLFTVVLRSCRSHFWWLAVVVSLSFNFPFVVPMMFDFLF